VPADLSEPIADLDCAADALGALETTHEEFDNFFGDVFDQLQSLSLELFARHKCLELRTQHQEEQETTIAEHQQQFQQLLEELRQLRGDMQRSAEEQQHAQAEFRTAQEGSQQERAGLHDVQEELRRAWAEFHAAQEELQRQRGDLRETQTALEEHLARLAATAAELAEARSQSPAATVDAARQQQLEQLLDEARQQRASWEHERTAMEAELELVRNRAAELSETLAEQRHQAAEQQAALAGEMKRMRALLEAISGRMRSEPAAGSDPAKPPSQADDPVLDSVLAQFEMLQRDIAERRVSKSKERSR
jgi:chromosome segregation ATPase